MLNVRGAGDLERRENQKKKARGNRKVSRSKEKSNKAARSKSMASKCSSEREAASVLMDVGQRSDGISNKFQGPPLTGRRRVPNFNWGFHQRPDGGSGAIPTRARGNSCRLCVGGIRMQFWFGFPTRRALKMKRYLALGQVMHHDAGSAFHVSQELLFRGGERTCTCKLGANRRRMRRI